MTKPELLLELQSLQKQNNRLSRQNKKFTMESDVLSAVNAIFHKRITCKTDEELGKKCLEIAEILTDSKFGFIGELNPSGRFDTIAISNPGWDACKMPDSEVTMLINDMEVRGIWGRVIKNGESLIVNKPATHPDSVGVPKDHPPLTSFLGAPLKNGNNVTGMIALANKDAAYTKENQKALETLSIAINESLHSKRVELAIERQTQEILEMSTPVLRIWEGILVAPLIGSLDSERARKFMDRFLSSITETNARFTLLDITGVPAVDTQIAQHLIDSIDSARLLGTTVILTGVRPSLAQTFVHLGIDLSGIRTHTSLAGGFKIALKEMGIELSGQDDQ